MQDAETTLKTMHQLHTDEVNLAAYQHLEQLLKCCTINLIATVTGITRRTLYRWTDTDRSLEEMDVKVSTYFLVHCAYNPKIQMLLQRGPISHPRLAKRLLDEGEDNVTA